MVAQIIQAYNLWGPVTEDMGNERNKNESSVSISSTGCPIHGAMELRAEQEVSGWRWVKDGMNFGYLKLEQAVERS